MDTLQTLGLIVVAMGVADAAMGRFVIAPRVADERQRQLLMSSMLLSGMLMVLLGAALMLGVFG